MSRSPLAGLFGSCVLLLTSTIAPGCGAGHPSTTGPPGAAVVVRDIDGDTIIVRIGDHDERVRFIGIDTPESVSLVTPVECYGVEAKHRTAALLPPGTKVLLQRDVEVRDKYARLLAYITRASDGMLVNLELVQEGYAASFRFPPNTAHESEFAHAEAAAKAAHRGLWPTCGGTNTPATPGAGGSVGG